MWLHLLLCTLLLGLISQTSNGTVHRNGPYSISSMPENAVSRDRFFHRGSGRFERIEKRHSALAG